MKITRSIRTKLTISIVLFFTVFAVCFLSMGYVSFKSNVEQTAILNMESTISLCNNALENQLTDIINIELLTTLQTNSTLSTNILNILEQPSLSDAEKLAYRRTANEYLISLCSFKKYLNGMMLCNYSGESVQYGTVTPFSVLKENNWLDSIPASSADTLFIDPHYQTLWFANKNDLVFSAIKPVFSNSQEPIGFVVADINCQIFDSSYSSISNNNNPLFIVNPATGSVLYSTTPSFIDAGAIVEPEIQSALVDERGNTTVPFNGEEYIMVFAKSELTGWTTVSMVKELDLLYSFSNVSRSLLRIYIILMILLTLLVFAFVQLFTGNILKLTQAVKNINPDTLELTVKINSKDEIQDLYQQFKNQLQQISTLISEVHDKEEEKRKSEIAALQFQMNPHFLYNSLNTIKFLASIQGIENISQVSEQLSSLMHINMDGRTFLTVTEDIQFIKSYIDIQTYRYTNTFRLHISCDEAISDCKLPKLIIQPLVENALKHGMTENDDDFEVNVKYRNQSGNLQILVSDNGIGLSYSDYSSIINSVDSSSKNAGHIGLRNIIERLQLYYGTDAKMDLKETDSGTCFEIIIPQIKEDSDND